MEAVENSVVKKRKRKSWAYKNPNEHTLCWDCALATSDKCPWADHGEPVEGWGARATKIKHRHGTGDAVITDSFHVWRCPLFERDAAKGGCEKVALGGETNDKKHGGNKPSSASAVYRMAITPDSGRVGNSNRPVADSQNGGTRVLNPPPNDREILNLAYGILEGAVDDWKALDYGRKAEAMVERGEFVKREDMVEFFFSRWFTQLCEPLHYSPEEIREALNIPPDAWRIVLSQDEGRIERAFDRQTTS